MSTLVFTIAQNGYDTAFLSCIASQRAYARSIGADFVCVSKPRRISDTALSAWLKIPLMLHAMESGYDWVAYIDADCEIKQSAPDFRKDLESESGDVFMALGRSERVNSGVMIGRNSAQSRAFFDTVLKSIETPIPADDRQSLKYENGNVIYVAREYGGVTILAPEWNNTQNPQLVDHIRHYTGPMRPLLKRSLFREVQYRILKRSGSRQLTKFQRQPESRGLDFVSALSKLEQETLVAYPQLRLHSVDT